MSITDVKVLDPSLLSDKELLEIFKDARSKGAVFTMNVYNECACSTTAKNNMCKLISSVFMVNNNSLDYKSPRSLVECVSSCQKLPEVTEKNKESQNTSSAVAITLLSEDEHKESVFPAAQKGMMCTSAVRGACNMNQVADSSKKNEKMLVTKKNYYKCFVCSMMLPSRAAYGMHHYRTHVKDGRSCDEHNFQCSLCQKTLATPMTYLDHILLHADIKEYCCKMCNMHLPSRKHLYRHKIVFHKKHFFTCNICQKKFHFESEFKRHVSFHKDIKPHKCVHCGVGFVTNYQLKRHWKTHQINHQDFSCTICKMVFKSKVLLAKHYKENHQTNKSYVCDKCGASYMHPGGLQRHLLTHEPERHKCMACSKLFVRKSSLAVHMRSHSGEKPHKCQQCGKSFAQKSSLNRHTSKLQDCKPKRVQETT